MLVLLHNPAIPQGPWGILEEFLKTSFGIRRNSSRILQEFMRRSDDAFYFPSTVCSSSSRVGPYLPASPGLYYLRVFPEPFDIVGGALVVTFAFLGTSEGAPVCAPALGQLNYCLSCIAIH